jgi:hypothetical protein
MATHAVTISSPRDGAPPDQPRLCQGSFQTTLATRPSILMARHRLRRSRSSTIAPSRGGRAGQAMLPFSRPGSQTLPPTADDLQAGSALSDRIGVRQRTRLIQCSAPSSGGHKVAGLSPGLSQLARAAARTPKLTNTKSCRRSWPCSRWRADTAAGRSTRTWAIARNHHASFLHISVELDRRD